MQQPKCAPATIPVPVGTHEIRSTCFYEKSKSPNLTASESDMLAGLGNPVTGQGFANWLCATLLCHGSQLGSDRHQWERRHLGRAVPHGSLAWPHRSVGREVSVSDEPSTVKSEYPQNIHSKNLIHFDIKPDNILLSDRNEGLVADFGQAKQMNLSGIAAQDRIYGKMLPPEALLSDHFGRTFDIYQAGLTIYRMCNGDAEFYRQFSKYGTAAAFDRPSFLYDLRNGKFPDRSIFPPHIPGTLRNAVKKCLQVDPARRFQSAIEVTNAIAGIDGECLDWSYAPAADKRVWTKVTDDSEYEIIVNSDGSSACYKSVNGGTRRRVSAGTKPSMTDRELKAFFSEY